MHHWLTTVAALSAIYVGMSGLCLAMERHFSQVFGKEPRRAQQRLLRFIGWLLLVLSLYFSIQSWGGVVGPFVWIAALTAMTGILVMLISYRSNWAMGITGLCLAVLVSAVGARLIL